MSSINSEWVNEYVALVQGVVAFVQEQEEHFSADKLTTLAFRTGKLSELLIQKPSEPLGISKEDLVNILEPVASKACEFEFDLSPAITVVLDTLVSLKLITLKQH